MIRLLHTSDWHLGRSLYGQSLLEDQAFILDRLLELIDERSPHAILVAGDIFDRPTPPEGAVTLFDRFLNEAAGKRRIPVVIIPGNHDSCERVGFASGLLRERKVTIFARLEDAFSPVEIKGDGDAVAKIYGIPFVEPMLIGRLLERDDVKTPDAAIGSLCRALLEKKTCSQPAVLLCHAFVAGGEVSDSEKEIHIGGSSQVDPRAFEGFSYTALGHLHKPQRAGRDNIRYSGSLLPYSKSEVGHVKSITEITLHGDGKTEVTAHRLKQRRGLRYIEGELQSLIESGTDDPLRDDYLIAGFTDTGAVLDAYSKLRAVYPNLLHVSRSGGFVPTSLPALAAMRERETISDLDLFANFFLEATGTELSTTERDTLIVALGELEREGGLS